LTARTIIAKKDNAEIVMLDCEKTILEAINTMHMLNISQIPVTQKEMVVGKLAEGDILKALMENPSLKSAKVQDIMTAGFPFVDLNTSIDRISALINKENSAVLVEDEGGKIEIITQYDIINAISG
jgi:cystathionine beta-synthase